MVRRYLKHLDHSIEASPFDLEDRRMALQEDRQGIGLSRRTIDLPEAFSAQEFRCGRGPLRICVELPIG